MSEAVALFTAVLGLCLIAIAVAWLEAGAHRSIGGLFPLQGRDDWPRGVQEEDAPHYALEHTDALRPDPAGAAATGLGGPLGVVDDAADPRPEIVELYARRLTPLAPPH